MSNLFLSGASLRPTRDLLFVQPLPAGELKVGSVWIPDRARAKPMSGTVLAVGPLVQDVSPGDKVVYSRRSGSYVRVNKLDKLLVLREQDCICVLG